MSEAAEIAVPIIKRFEGLAKLGRDGLVYPYICPAGYPTQGYGLLVESLKAPPITREEAEARLLARVPFYEGEALKLSPVLHLCPPEALAAITDFVFNLGAGRYRASTLRKKVDAQDWPGVAQELVKWVRGGGRVLPGLVARRHAECELLCRAGLLKDEPQ